MNRSKACLALLICFTSSMFTACGWNRDARFRDDTIYIGGFRGREKAQKPRRAPHDDISYWDGDGVPGSPRIRISLSEQRAFFFKGDQLVGVSSISTGREGYNTPAGSFSILQKDRDHVSGIYGDYVDAVTGEVIKKDIDRSKDKMPRGARYDGAPMPYFMRITGGIGMHEGFLPGYAASHGCIRMPGFMAEKFFQNVSMGTPVSVTH
jgi:hypothetical protein